ncbi:MAG TPA: DUF3089 domain-containing protein [Thermoleophilaceae bacterium]|nr:DUF3089 domain-containing protein [Thermoleophilaceae bacterium]
MPRPALFLLPVTAFACLAAAGPAAAKTSWLCKPGLKGNACTPSLTTTLYSSSNKPLRTATPKADRKKGFDCFYVYPTVSDQKTLNATRAKDAAQREIARFQAARFGQHCRVYAPVYRQLTLKGIMGAQAGQAAGARKAYSDVEAAWKDYLKRYNDGRGVVLVGHSQGAGMLSELVRRQFDRKPAARKRLIAAYLLGGNVTVKKGSDRGGSFRNVRACRAATQTGCVVAFSTFNQTPPANSIFGRTGGRFEETFGQGSGADLEVLCTNPAALGGGSANLTTVLPSRPFSEKTTIGIGNKLVGITVPTPRTTYVEYRGTFSARCSSAGGARTLQVTSRGGAPVPKAVPDATWGLHLLDGNIALGDLAALSAGQARAWARKNR